METTSNQLESRSLVFSNNKSKITEVDPGTIKAKLDLNKIGFLGSCFASEMHSRFDLLGVDSWCNPSGTLYNPESIKSIIERFLSPTDFEISELFQTREGFYRSWLFDTTYSSKDPDALITALNRSKHQFNKEWNSTGTLIITLGTANVYTLIEEKFTVNNCHKELDSLFTKRTLTNEEIHNSLKSIIELSPKKNIIWTLSPIRHMKDGASSNSLSKALLRVGIDSILDKKNHYFSSYEIVMDELRDYSHYGDDGSHLNKNSVDKIADKFINYLNSDLFTKELKLRKKISQLKAHTPRDKSSQKDIDEKINLLESQLKR